MASAQATEAQASAHAGAHPGGLIEWFWRGHALETAKAAPKATSVRRERLRRARLAAELGDRTIDPAEPLRDGSALPLAISLFREAAYWALLARDERPSDVPSDVTDATAPTLRELVEAGTYTPSGLGAADFALVKSVLGEQSFVETAAERPEILSRQADLSQAFVHGLIQGEIEADDQVTTVLVQRWLRLGAVGLVLAVVLFMVYGAAQRAMQGPDLALGKPWRASSSAFECHPKEMECGGARSAMFFHTNEEKNPWVEIDLGAPMNFSRLEVVNRDDCCQERAIPMLVETSNDQKTWKELARRKDTFRTWETTFKQTSARYVRLKIERRTAMHLSRVTVREH